MKANKKTMLGVALAVAVIALAGIGYAVGYQGYTESTGNNVKAEFVTVKLTSGAGQGEPITGESAYTGQVLKLKFDTKTVDNEGTEEVQYKMHETSTTLVIGVVIDAKNQEEGKTYDLTIHVPALTVPGASVRWSYSSTGVTTPVTQGGTEGDISVNGKTIDNFANGALTLTLSQSADYTAGTVPANGVIPIDTITFTVVEHTA